MKREATYIPQKRFLYSSEWNITFCRMGRKRYIQYTYIDGEVEEHIVGYAFTNEFVCDYSSLMRSGLSLVNIQSHNRVFCIWNIPSWHYWILGNGYAKTLTIRKACGRESIWKWYMNDYLIHIVSWDTMERCGTLS